MHCRTVLNLSFWIFVVMTVAFLILVEAHSCLPDMCCSPALKIISPFFALFLSSLFLSLLSFSFDLRALGHSAVILRIVPSFLWQSGEWGITDRKTRPNPVVIQRNTAPLTRKVVHEEAGTCRPRGRLEMIGQQRQGPPMRPR